MIIIVRISVPYENFVRIAVLAFSRHLSKSLCIEK